MKISDFNILILVFLISGVMFLFFNSEIHAQNNARREFKFHQENIRSKKRNNDLQKIRRTKKRSGKSEKNKLRFRFFSSYHKPAEDGERDGYSFKEFKDVKYSSLGIIYNKLGFSRSHYKKHFENIYPEVKSYSWGERYRLDSINVSYLFGDEFSFVIGTSVYLFKGYAEKWNWNDDGSKFVHSSENISGNISFIALGLQMEFLEFVLDLRNVGDVKFEDFKCSQGNCGNETKFKEEPITLSTTINFGLGFVF